MTQFDFAQIYKLHDVYPAGQTIFKAGDVGDCLYILLEGEIQISLSNHVLDHLTSGAIFGEMALVDSEPRSADAIAKTVCKLVKIDEKRFTELAGQNPRFGIEVMRIMSSRLRRLIDDEIKRQRLEQELVIGQKIQLSLLPKRFPEKKGWQFAAVYQAARQVGGDFYDFIQSPNNPNVLTITVADVTGKGVPAAIFMASMRSVIRTLCIEERSPATILTLTNQAIVQDSGAALFLSCVIARLNTQTNQLTLANAGHEWPLWIKVDKDDVETLYVPGVVLGAFHQVAPLEKTVTIEAGDFLLFFTDGVTEARNEEGDFFGDERLLETAVAGKHDSAAEMVKRIETAVAAFTQGMPQSDDLTLMVIKKE